MASRELVVEIASDGVEDDRIRLEARASLARLDPPAYTPRIIAQAAARTAGDRHAMAMAMEAIFILSELETAEAGEALAASRTTTNWTLRRERVRMGTPTASLRDVSRLLDVSPREAASAAALLAMQGDEGIAAPSQPPQPQVVARRWATAALGELPETDVRRVADGALPSDLERALVPVWTQSRSWLRQRELDTPLRFMQRQTIRHLA